MDTRELLKDKQKIVIKVGSSSLIHSATGNLNLIKLEKLVRELCDLKNQGKDVVLVSSGAIGVGRSALGLKHKPDSISLKQACAAVGQAKLMMTYQKLFSEYNQNTAQILMTKYTMTNNLSRMNAKNTFDELLNMGVIPIVNENDTVSTYEMQFGDNDTLSAIVASLINADLLILLSDIDGLFTDDPNTNVKAQFIECVEQLDDQFMDMAKDSTSSDVGTGGMATKLQAAKIATESGVDMIIANGEDMSVIHKIFEGKKVGTLFLRHENEDFYLIDFIEENL
ncbi:MAG: glutamate 5-kinase [Lachnotalea sp.]